MDFSASLRQARESAQLSQEALARQAGIDVRTVRNLERGTVQPSRDTLARLRSVEALGFGEATGARDSRPDLQPNAYLAPHHDSLQIARDMAATLASAAGGHLEQTWLYLDAKGAADWLTLSSSGPYAQAFRDSMPLGALAGAVAEHTRGHGLDFHALGAGDGVSEARVAHYLCDARGPAPDLRLCLLDISPPLVHAAYRHAADGLEGRGVVTWALVGNFLDLKRIPVLSYRPAGSARLRLFTLLGCTWQNLTDGPAFLRQLADVTGPGDLLALDCRQARAPAGDAAAIRAAEPVLTHGVPATHHEWLSGPIRRYCEGYASIAFRAELHPRGLVPGSYSINLLADVTMRAGRGPRRSFTLLRGNSYDPAQLAAAVEPLGWHCVESWPYGLAAPKPDHVLLLLRRMGG